MAHHETAPNVLRFNGAATLSLRKSTPWHDRNEVQFELQWGRNFIVAEILTTSDIVLVKDGGLQWGRNFIVAEMLICICWSLWGC